MKMQLQEKPIKFIRSKTDDSVKVGIHYTVEEIILLRSLMTSKVRLSIQLWKFEFHRIRQATFQELNVNRKTVPLLKYFPSFFSLKMAHRPKRVSSLSRSWWIRYLLGVFQLDLPVRLMIFVLRFLRVSRSSSTRYMELSPTGRIRASRTR